MTEIETLVAFKTDGACWVRTANRETLLASVEAESIAAGNQPDLEYATNAIVVSGEKFEALARVLDNGSRVARIFVDHGEDPKALFLFLAAAEKRGGVKAAGPHWPQVEAAIDAIIIKSTGAAPENLKAAKGGEHKKRRPKEEWLPHALMVLYNDSNMTLTQIAKTVDVARTTLYNEREFRIAWERHELARKSRSMKHGRLAESADCRDSDRDDE